MLAGFICGSARIDALVVNRAFMDPVNELANFLSGEPLDGNAMTPLLPFSESREVFGLSSCRWLAARRYFVTADMRDVGMLQLQRPQQLLPCPILLAGGVPMHLANCCG